jgi:hypothetical protein
MQQPSTHKQQSLIDWITIFLLIGNTANPFFFQSIEMLELSFAVLLGLWFLTDDQQTQVGRYIWIYLIVLTVLQASQTLVYHVFPIKTFLGEYLRIAFAVMALRLLGRHFFDSFVKFVYFFAVISLCFFIPCLLIHPLGPFLVSHVAKYTVTPFSHANLEDFYVSKENLIIFNLGQLDLHRNSGFYWEPGAHGAFLVLALFFNLFYRKEKWSSSYNIVFLITILTTLSTTTYLAVFFVMLVYLKDYLIRSPWISSFLLVSIVGIAMLAFNKLDFLHDKINTQLEKSESGRAGESRFGSFLLDVQETTDHPLIGTGRAIEMKYGKTFYNVGWQQRHRNNGIGVLLNTYGILFFFFFFYLNWRSFYKLLDNKVDATTGLILVLIIGFSEDYFFKAFFIALTLFCGITDVPVSLTRIVRSRKLQLGKNSMTYNYD